MVCEPCFDCGKFSDSGRSGDAEAVAGQTGLCEGSLPRTSCGQQRLRQEEACHQFVALGAGEFVVALYSTLEQCKRTSLATGVGEVQTGETNEARRAM